jgi:hypothetical protein
MPFLFSQPFSIVLLLVGCPNCNGYPKQGCRGCRPWSALSDIRRDYGRNISQPFRRSCPKLQRLLRPSTNTTSGKPTRSRVVCANKRKHLNLSSVCATNYTLSIPSVVCANKRTQPIPSPSTNATQGKTIPPGFACGAIQAIQLHSTL